METQRNHWPFARGEMSALVRQHAWHRTPLGSSSRWPVSLRTATDLLLATPLPALIIAGPDGVVLYNDASIPMLGSAHPALLGSALSTASGGTASRFDALSDAVGAGETVFTDDNWLGLLDESGAPVTLRLACVPLRGVAGEILGIWAQQVVSAAPHASTATQPRLSVPVERYSSAIESDIVGISFFGADGVVTEANERYCALHGIHRNEIRAGQARWGDGTAPEWLTLFSRSIREYHDKHRVLPHEKEYVRRDGERWWGLSSVRRLSTDEAVEYTIDISPRMAVEQSLKESERWARTLVEGIPQIVWRSRDGGEWTWVSPQWTELTGQPQAHSRGLGWLEMVHPDDRKEAHAIWGRANWQQAFEANYRLWHIREGRFRAFKTRAAPLRDSSGQIREWLGTSTDIEDLEQLHGRTRVLVAELQHRTRNLLALVRSVAAHSLGSSGVDDPRYTDFNQRLTALSRAQSLITRGETERVDLESLIRAELAALHDVNQARIAIHGPATVVPPGHAQMLALVIHELATNAMKHGALGTPGGELNVSWTTAENGNAGPVLLLEWREAGVVMPAEPPHRRGFGRKLIEDALQFTLRARSELRFGPDGIICSIALPLANARATSVLQ
jgi:PAS domain S-box-containing protein